MAARQMHHITNLPVYVAWIRAFTETDVRMHTERIEISKSTGPEEICRTNMRHLADLVVW